MDSHRLSCPRIPGKKEKSERQRRASTSFCIFLHLFAYSQLVYALYSACDDDVGQLVWPRLDAGAIVGASQRMQSIIKRANEPSIANEPLHIKSRRIEHRASRWDWAIALRYCWPCTPIFLSGFFPQKFAFYVLAALVAALCGRLEATGSFAFAGRPQSIAVTARPSLRISLERPGRLGSLDRATFPYASDTVQTVRDISRDISRDDNKT